MNQTLLVILCTCGAMLLILGLLIGTWYVSNRRKERRILKFKASDFRDLGTVTRNSMAMKDLQALYRKVKYSVTYAANHGKFSTFVLVGNKLPHIYGAQFTKLILNPFIDKLTKEGFSVTYLPNGSMQMEKQNKEPAFEVSWKDAEDQDDNEDTEDQDETV